jgi:hypothetical protein
LVAGRLGGRLLSWIWTWPRWRAGKMDEARWRRIRGSIVLDPASRWCARQPWRRCNGNCPRPATVQDPASRHKCLHPSPSPVSCILPLSSVYASKASSFSLQFNM